MFLVKNMIKNIKTKSWGFYVALVPFLITIIYSILYIGVDKSLYNPSTVVWGFVGAGLFLILALFLETSQFAALPLMAANLFGLIGIIEAQDFIDYITTAFFGGFSFQTLLSLPVSFWFPLVGSLISFVISCVAIYLPQNKKELKEEE